jgi:hypothetical protein
MGGLQVQVVLQILHLTLVQSTRGPMKYSLLYGTYDDGLCPIMGSFTLCIYSTDMLYRAIRGHHWSKLSGIWSSLPDPTAAGVIAST